MLVSTDKIKDTLKKYTELWDKIKDLIKSITNISNYYDKKYIILRENIMFPFHGNIMFSEFFFKRKCKKAASFRKCVFLGKYEIFVYDSCA